MLTPNKKWLLTLSVILSSALSPQIDPTQTDPTDPDLFLMILGSELVFLYTYSFICSRFHLSITASAVLLCSLPGDGFLLCLHCYELLFVITQIVQPGFENLHLTTHPWRQMSMTFSGEPAHGEPSTCRKFLDITSNFKLEAHIIIVMKVFKDSS